MKNRIWSFTLTLVLLCTLAVNASASDPIPDLSQNGSITFSMDLNDVLLDSGSMNLCKVGEIEKQDSNYSFQLIEKLQDSDVLLDKLDDPILAEELLTLAKEKDLEKITAPITEGKAVFTDLPVGLYVVWQDDQDATRGFSPIQPFLISVPKFQDDEYALDVTADPKVPVETTPPETTTPPSPPDEYLPYTGQLNWPIPVMALSGAVLFIVGWILCAGRKRTENEK